MPSLKIPPGLFDTTDKEVSQNNDAGIRELQVIKLVPFSKHPFKLYEGQRLEDLIQSIREQGVITPIIVRTIKDDDNFEILAGHNRVNASKKAGLDTVPSIIKENLADEDAMLVVTETNLYQRSFADLSHSERAAALTAHMSALRKQGRRTDLLNEIQRLSNADGSKADSTSVQNEQKLNSRQNVEEKYNLSASQITRYLRIDKLDNCLKNRVDTEEIGLLVGVRLSYLNTAEQNMVDTVITEDAVKVDIRTAELLKEKAGNLSYDKVRAILLGDEKPKGRPATKYKLPQIPIKKVSENVRNYFTETSDKKEIEDTIIKALEMYFGDRGE